MQCVAPFEISRFERTHGNWAGLKVFQTGLQERHVRRVRNDQ
jgi:hypothetical protein